MATSAKPRVLQAFLLALIAAVCVFLPFIIYDKGYFIYYGDFNVQQIPFYQLAHRAVRSGDVFWSWYTDLGANFVGSYSFYLLFSPFFWLTIPFPTDFLPHLMAPLLALKTAFASMTACLFISRFTKDARYGVLGGLLYAFSGWMDFNIFFNHFHDVAVFFPLLLVGVEALVQEDRKGVFAAAVAINAAVNYWFFIGEAVFVILYVLIRRTDPGWRLSLRKFLLIALESVLGVGIAAVALLPSVLALMGNWRTGSSEMLQGWNVWLYWHEQRQPAIIQSMFFPPEPPSRPNFMPGHGAKWASLSAWLPLFAMTGVLAYFFKERDNWLKKMLALCCLFAMVPVLNSLFILLNGSYYARWFYMPILLMAVVTVRAVEDSAEDPVPFTRAFKWSAIVILVFAAMSGLTPNADDDGNLLMGMAEDPLHMWIYTIIAMACLIVAALLILHLRGHRRFWEMTVASVLVVAVGFNIYLIAANKNNRDRGQWIIDHAIKGSENIDLPAEPFARTDVFDSMDNIAMFWGLPNIQAFHSIVPPSIMNFYPEVGVTRDVGSRPEPEYYALRSLLSVRWLFIEEGGGIDDVPMPGYTYYDTQNGFHVYENDNFLPMGYAYDICATYDDLMDVEKNSRGNFMLRALVLDDEAIERNIDLLRKPVDQDFYDLHEDNLALDAEKRRRDTADSFQIDNKGFTATTSFDSPRMLFFSVPWESGWSAQVRIGGGDWVPLRIEQAHIGFMAVRAPQGNAEIRFDYATPGLATGAVISGGFLLFLIGYLLLARRPAGADTEDLGLQRSMLYSQSWNDYLVHYPDPESRSIRFREMVAEDAARRSAALTPPADNPEDSGNDK